MRRWPLRVPGKLSAYEQGRLPTPCSGWQCPVDGGRRDCPESGRRRWEGSPRRSWSVGAVAQVGRVSAAVAAPVGSGPITGALAWRSRSARRTVPTQAQARPRIPGLFGSDLSSHASETKCLVFRPAEAGALSPGRAGQLPDRRRSPADRPGRAGLARRDLVPNPAACRRGCGIGRRTPPGSNVTPA